ncbi:helix-turn-helix domain-containing protein [Neptunomonas japonica]|uniref:XRE family transcriptional regulator n=1 Tax=Neptunomonas japonica JAMM 1380 TaxID=1441457 RepID=A0A7R6SXG1_9GAMM|nr:helix-turn-helix transcriptional regulator [Neptunomonas japonica]BBB31471.1 XRE family transcriptional regulator [Neptunomonas japonica JAMM 1380]
MDEQLLLCFGSHIKSIRISQQLSQEQLALKAGLDRTYISGIERGKRNVSLVNLVKLAKALNLPLSGLMSFDTGFSND